MKNGVPAVDRRSSRSTIDLAPVVGSVSAVIALVLYYGLGRLRWFARDEGQFALAADLVRAGKAPWADFLYQQGPALPYLLAPFGRDILTLRVTSAVMASALVGLLAWHTAKHRSALGSVYVVTALLSCWYLATWMPTVKTQAGANLFGVAGALVVVRGALSGLSSRWVSVGAGALIGVASLIKIPCLVILAPVALWMLWVAPDRRRALRDVSLLILTAGLVVLGGCLVTGASLRQIVFNLVIFHNSPLEIGGSQRFGVLRTWLLDVHAAGLILLGIGSLAVRRSGAEERAANDHLLALAIASVLTVGYFLGRPSQVQYFAYAAPFWVWAGTPALDAVARRLGRWLSGPVIAAWLVAVVYSHGMDIARSPFSHQSWFAIAEVQQARAVLRRNLPVGAEVASIWPGFVAGTGHRPTPGMESGQGLIWASRLTVDERRELHLMRLEDLAATIQAGGPEAVVVTAEDVRRFGFSDALLEPAYRAALQTEWITVWIRKDLPNGDRLL